MPAHKPESGVNVRRHKRDVGQKYRRGGSARRNQEVIDRFQMGKEEEGMGGVMRELIRWE